MIHIVYLSINYSHCKQEEKLFVVDSALFIYFLYCSMELPFLQFIVLLAGLAIKLASVKIMNCSAQ